MIVIIIGTCHLLAIAAIAAHDHLLSYDVHITVTDRLVINSTKKNIRGRL